MDRDNNAPFMLPVSEKYNELGTMVMGKIESGRVKKGDTLLVMPNRVSREAVIFIDSVAEYCRSRRYLHRIGGRD